MKKIFERILNFLTDEDIETTSNDTSSEASPTEILPNDDFHTLLYTILNKKTIGPINEVNDTITELLENLDLMQEFEGYLTNKYTEYQEQNPSHTQDDFIRSFGASFKHTQLLDLLPFHAKKINIKVEQAYFDIVNYIQRIQSELDHANLRIMAEVDVTNMVGYRSKLYQCNTPFCLVILKCDGDGRYNIVYAIDQNILDMIGHIQTSNLLRIIYENTSNEISKHLQVFSLKDDCFSDFEKVLKMSASKEFIRITQN